MLENTRRRALGLLAAAAGLRLFPPLAFAAQQAARKEKECLAGKDFGTWRGVATNDQAGARMGQIPFVESGKCELFADIQISSSFEGKLVVFGDPDFAPLPKEFLIKPENRLLARADDGPIVVDEPLCGVCTDIFEDKVSIVLPLACAPLFREADSVEMTIKLGDSEDCRFRLDCKTLRQAIAWAQERKPELAKQHAEDKCTPPEGCFITSACCETLGLADDCFELAALRNYRDEVLAATPAGRTVIARYYEIAPLILASLPPEERTHRLLRAYGRFILPSAIAARLGLDRLAYRLYLRMLAELGERMGTKAPPLPH